MKAAERTGTLLFFCFHLFLPSRVLCFGSFLPFAKERPVHSVPRESLSYKGPPGGPRPRLELEVLFLSTSSSRACAARRTPVATHALEGSIRPKALEMLLAFMCEGECEIDEGQLTEVLAIGSRLGGRAGGCKTKIKSPLWESNP